MKRPEVDRAVEAERERAAQLAAFERRLDAVIETLRRDARGTRAGTTRTRTTR